MALLRALRGAGGLGRLLEHRCGPQIAAAQPRLELSSAQRARFGTSSDDEATQRDDEDGAQRAVEDSKSREEYRSWVENMLASIKSHPEAEQPAEAQAADASLPSSAAEQAAAPEAGPEVSASVASHGQPEAVLEAPATDGHPAEEPRPAEPGTEADASPSRPAVPQRTTMREGATALPDAVLGFRELGVPASGRDAALLDQGQGSVNRFRRFQPGDAYEPEDLVNPRSDFSGPFGGRARQASKVRKATSAEARAAADFRNLPFLNRFTSEMGQLPPRRVTRLKKSVHVHVMRQIKIARQMALLPHEGKRPDLRAPEQQ